MLHAGDHKFNDIQPWQYHKLPEVLGGGRGYEIRTEGEFEQALRSALADTDADAICSTSISTCTIAARPWNASRKSCGCGYRREQVPPCRMTGGRATRNASLLCCFFTSLLHDGSDVGSIPYDNR